MIQSISEMIVFFREKHTGLKGCAIDEIAQLEQHYQITLPSAYRAFLMLLGHGAIDYEVGSDYEYSWLFELKDYANGILKENNRQTLPDNTFVFWGHHGYQFLYFYTDTKEDDPLVYYYNECYEIQDFLKISSLIQVLCEPEIRGKALKTVKCKYL